MYISETLRTPLCDHYDVVVCGGGFAGISAALAARREGSRVLLVEHLYMLGGLATAGLVTIYLPLCDGYGRQVSFGIADELFRLSMKHGAEAMIPDNWLTEGGSRTEHDKRLEVRFNAQLFAILAEELLTKEGVDILYGSHVVGAQVEDGKIKYILVENKTGRSAYSVRSVVDATGDCDVAEMAGAPTAKLGQGNVLAAWYYSIGEKGYNLHMLGASDIPDEEKKQGVNAPAPLVSKRFEALTAEELSEMTRLSHRVLLADYLKKKETHGVAWPVTIATTPQVRMTRRIVGEYEMDIEEEHTHFDDSIGLVSNWKKRGPVYEVPFRTLYSKSVKNLVVAGRSTSVKDALWDVMRVIPCCAVTGQAAGTAAAMCDDMTCLDITALQKHLRENGVVIHENEL
jgi:hypothetical protein